VPERSDPRRSLRRGRAYPSESESDPSASDSGRSMACTDWSKAPQKVEIPQGWKVGDPVPEIKESSATTSVQAAASCPARSFLQRKHPRFARSQSFSLDVSLFGRSATRFQRSRSHRRRPARPLASPSPPSRRRRSAASCPARSFLQRKHPRFARSQSFSLDVSLFTRGRSSEVFDYEKFDREARDEWARIARRKESNAAQIKEATKRAKATGTATTTSSATGRSSSAPPSVASLICAAFDSLRLAILAHSSRASRSNFS
jgi:hypothetical protein